MTLKSVGQAFLLLLAGWAFSFATNVFNYFAFKQEVTKGDLWEDAISFTVFMLAAQFYDLKNTCIDVAKVFDETAKEQS